MSTPEITPLEMAQNAAAAVLQYADAQAADPVRAYIEHAGMQGHQAATLAGNMALVSIAESLAAFVEAFRPAIAQMLDEVLDEDQAASSTGPGS